MCFDIGPYLTTITYRTDIITRREGEVRVEKRLGEGNGALEFTTACVFIFYMGTNVTFFVLISTVKDIRKRAKGESIILHVGSHGSPHPQVQAS